MRKLRMVMEAFTIDWLRTEETFAVPTAVCICPMNSFLKAGGSLAFCRISESVPEVTCETESVDRSTLPIRLAASV